MKLDILLKWFNLLNSTAGKVIMQFGTCNFKSQSTEGRMIQPSIMQGFFQVTAHCKERCKNLIRTQQDDY